MPAVEIQPPAPLEGETTEQLELMRRGEPYIATDAYLTRVRQMGADKIHALNQVSNMDERMRMFKGWVGMPEEGKVYIAGPFTAEYGFNLSFGTEIYIGPSCTFLDVARITLGDRTMVGANCSLYTPGHPVSPEARNGLQGPEWGKEIIIGDDCWIGGSVVIVGPCRIGNGVTIGAGSVVTKDIPDRCVAVGNPARVIKRINADGSTERVQKA